MSNTISTTAIKRSSLCSTIETAFESVELGNGVGVYEAEAMDNYADDVEISNARVKDRQAWVHWRDIPDSVITVCTDTLCFVDSEGMRFLLPPFMLFSVKNYEVSNSMAVDSVIYALDSSELLLDNVGFLTSEQKSVIALFLRYMIFESGDLVDSEVASHAYECYWSRYDLDL